MARVQRYEALPHRLITLELALHHLAMSKYGRCSELLIQVKQSRFECLYMPPRYQPHCLASPRLALPCGHSLKIQLCWLPLQTHKHTERRLAKLRDELAAALEQAASQGYELVAAEVFAPAEQGK